MISKINVNLQSFIFDNKVEYSKNLIRRKSLLMISKAMGVSVGKELADYILRYGYLAYKHSELYGINSIQFLNSDMVKQTIYLHTYYNETKNYISLENQGEGDYYLVNDKDEIYEFNTETRTLTSTRNKLYEYIIERFKSIQ